MSNASFQAVSQNPAVIFNLAEGTEYSPEVDQEPVGDSSPEIVKADCQDELNFNPEVSGSREVDTPLPAVDEQPGFDVIIDKGTESSDPPPNAPDEISDQSIAPINDENESDVTEDLPSSNLDQEPEDEYETFPNNIQIEDIRQGAEVLQEGLSQNHSKTYNRVSAFLNIPEEEYSEETLDEAVQVVRDYSAFCEMIGGGAIAVSTYHNIQEGKILNKTKEIDKKLYRKGWEERADKRFHYPKATRCARMSIASIEGVEAYCVVGTEKLRVAARAIAKTKVTGADQIKSLHEHFGETCDLNVGHVEFKRKFDSILAKALSSVDKDGDNQDDGNAKAPEENKDKKPAIENPPEEQPEGDDQKHPEFVEGQPVVQPVDPNVDPPIKGNPPSETGCFAPPCNNEEPAGEGPAATGGEVGNGSNGKQPDKKGNGPVKDNFLDQTSLNRWCASLIRAISKVRSNNPKELLKEKFSVEMIDKVIAELVNLKNDLISPEN